MTITTKQLEEWKAIAEMLSTPSAFRPGTTLLITEAIPSLIAEVERLRKALTKIADEEDIVNYGHTLPEIARRALQEPKP